MTSSICRNALIIIIICFLLLLTFSSSSNNTHELAEENSNERTRSVFNVTKEEPVVLTAALMTDKGVTQLEGDTWEDNIWTREIQKKYNIKIEYAWTADKLIYYDKITVCMSSGELPDLYSVNNQQFAHVAKSDLAYDMTRIFEQYASPLVKGNMNADIAGFNSGFSNGKLIGLSAQQYGLISIPSCLWIREDWMREKNLSPPKSLNELISLCEIFSMKDPDGNGIDDTYGLAVDKNLYDTNLSATGLAVLDGIFNAYQAYPGLWIKDEKGKIVYGSIQPEMKLGLETLQIMYKKGLISNNFGLMDSSKIVEDFVNQKVGVEIGSNWNGYWPGTNIVEANGSDAVLMPYPLPSANSEPMKVGVTWPIKQYYVVNKHCKNPEAVIKIANFALESNAQDFENFFGGNRGWNCPISIQDPTASDREFLQISGAITAGYASELSTSSIAKYTLAMRWVVDKDPSTVGTWLQCSPNGSFSILKQFFDSKNYVFTEYRGVDTETMTSKMVYLEKIERETITKIIMGASLDEFDKMVDKWRKLGGDLITEELNQANRE